MTTNNLTKEIKKETLNYYIGKSVQYFLTTYRWDGNINVWFERQDLQGLRWCISINHKNDSLVTEQLIVCINKLIEKKLLEPGAFIERRTNYYATVNILNHKVSPQYYAGNPQLVLLTEDDINDINNQI